MADRFGVTLIMATINSCSRKETEIETETEQEKGKGTERELERTHFIWPAGVPSHLPARCRSLCVISLQIQMPCISCAGWQPQTPDPRPQSHPSFHPFADVARSSSSRCPHPHGKCFRPRCHSIMCHVRRA